MKKEIYVCERGKQKKYFFHETYKEHKEAILIGKYYKKKEGSKYFILIDDESKRFTLYLDNMWNAL